MPDVVLRECRSYEFSACREALEKVLMPLGGLDFVKEGMCVVIKANLVSHMKPEKAATTHPTLLCALVQMLKERGAQVIIGDSPGSLYNAATLSMVYRATGMTETEQYGAELNRDFSQATAKNPDGKVCRNFQYTAYLDRADVIINFCKLKSHGMMAMSNGAKNLFGVIPGTMKPEYHYKFPNGADFARMIVDLDEYFKPVLTISDAVIGMEGNGPTAGTPREIGCIAASKSPHKLDLACAKILGLTKNEVPTLQAAYERGLIPETAEELDIDGDLSSFIVPDFVQVDNKNSLMFNNVLKGKNGKLLGKVVQKLIGSEPKVKKQECIGCKKCYEICPAKAITMKNGKPKIDRDKCIRCFCCQEFCPKGAMKVHRPIVARLLNR